MDTMRYSQLRHEPEDLKVPLLDEKSVTLHDDRHIVIKIATARHMTKVVAGYTVHIEGEEESVDPKPANGTFDSEKDAQLFYTAYIRDRYKDMLPPEVTEILKLFEWQLRQYSLFE